METDQNLTAWEEINPPMVSAPRPGLPTAYSARLEPASSDDFRNELTACLALVAPVGMTEEAKGEWLAVAWHTVGHLPADMLAEGCAKARAKADHPAKIVPIIIAETEEWMALRRKAAPPAPSDAPRLEAPRQDNEPLCTPEEAAEIMAEFGLRRNPLDVTTERAD